MYYFCLVNGDKYTDMKTRFLLFLFFFLFIKGYATDYVGCTKLQTLHLPACMAIGDSAFIACSEIELLTFPYSEPPVYGINAFTKPETITIRIDDQDGELISRWREIPEWNAFIWDIADNIEDIKGTKWEIIRSGNDLFVSGLNPNEQVRIITAGGIVQSFVTTSDGTLNVTLPGGFYIVNQANKSERIIITK